MRVILLRIGDGHSSTRVSAKVRAPLGHSHRFDRGIKLSLAEYNAWKGPHVCGSVSHLELSSFVHRCGVCSCEVLCGVAAPRAYRGTWMLVGKNPCVLFITCCKGRRQYLWSAIGDLMIARSTHVHPVELALR